MFGMIVVNGLAFGGVYAVLAVGFCLIFGVARILNMAHTAFYMIAGFVIFITANMLDLPLVVSAILAIIVTGLVGIGVHRLCLDRVKQHVTAVMIISVAIAMLFQEIFLIAFGGHYHAIDSFIFGSTEIIGAAVSYQHLLTIGASLVIIGAVWLLLSRTRLGNAIRAISQDAEIANVMGINVSRVSMISMGISAALAAVAAAAVGPIVMVHPLMWRQPLIIILAAVILGGLGSIKGSIIGAFILGFTEATVVALVPGGAFLRGAVSLSVMIVVLLVRPEGLFGVVFEEERL